MSPTQPLAHFSLIPRRRERIKAKNLEGQDGGGEKKPQIISRRGKPSKSNDTKAVSHCLPRAGWCLASFLAKVAKPPKTPFYYWTLCYIVWNRVSLGPLPTCVPSQAIVHTWFYSLWGQGEKQALMSITVQEKLGHECVNSIVLVQSLQQHHMGCYEENYILL